MIRGTVNATILGTFKSGMGHGVQQELCYGSIDGIADPTTHVMSGEDWWALQIATPANTVSIVPSDSHHGPVVT